MAPMAVNAVPKRFWFSINLVSRLLAASLSPAPAARTTSRTGLSAASYVHYSDGHRIERAAKNSEFLKSALSYILQPFIFDYFNSRPIRFHHLEIPAQ